MAAGWAASLGGRMVLSKRLLLALFMVVWIVVVGWMYGWFSNGCFPFQKEARGIAAKEMHFFREGLRGGEPHW